MGREWGQSLNCTTTKPPVATDGSTGRDVELEAKPGEAVDDAPSETVGDAVRFVQWSNAYQDQLDETAKLRFIGRRFEVRGLKFPSCELVVEVDAEIRKKTRAPVDARNAAQTDASRSLDEQYTAPEQRCGFVVGATTKAKGLETGFGR